jgi:ankyrin repeat protein
LKKYEHLPAPHSAAASGDIDRLKLLGGLETTLLASIDSTGRTPLFYSVLEGNLEATKFLIEKCPELVLSVDNNGDTPLHAATSAGDAIALEALIKAAGGKCDITNKMLMTPVHLAQNPECLEVLYAHGANMSAKDANGRSPLFIACAMNRDTVAEYLINCLDSEDAGEEMLMSPQETKIIWKLRRALAGLEQQQALELVLNRLKETSSNVEFLMQVQKSMPVPTGSDGE